MVRPRTQTSNACLCFTLMSGMPGHKPWIRTIGTRAPSRVVLLDLQENCEWKMDSTVMLCNIDPIKAFDDNMQVQCLPVYGSDQPKWTYQMVPKVASFRSFTRLMSWCKKPQKLTYHLCAQDLTRSTIVPTLPEDDHRALLEHGVLPLESSAKDRFCVMCPVKRGSPRLLPCCLRYNWVSYQLQLPDTPRQSMPLPCSDLGSEKEDLRHPYHEDCVVLPTRSTTRPDNKNIKRDVANRVLREDASLSRWSPASWLNLLLAKHAWLSASLVWVNGASESGSKGVFEEQGPDELESRPTINLLEQWEEGAHLPKLVNARNYSFPKSLVVPFTWMYAPRALSLSKAVNHVSQHDERDAWGQASQINLIAGTNYPNQPERNPGSHLSDPLTYWRWGVTLCPPELNDVSLAESGFPYEICSDPGYQSQY